MKTKKFLILLVLVIMMLSLAGCNHNITDEVKEAQKIANEFLTTKGYEIPRNYKINYVGTNKDKITIEHKNNEVQFDIFEDEAIMILIVDKDGISISQKEIDEIEKVAYDFLNTAGYGMPEKYTEIKYSGKDNKQLKVSKILEENNEITVTVTFNILENELEISDISYYIDEYVIYGPLIVFLVFIGIIILLVIICTEVDKYKLKASIRRY